MLISELTPVPTADLPIAEFRDHLRLGTGFSDDALQDPLLERHLRAAIAAVEAKTGKALYQRSFLWKLASWRGLQREELPVAPVSAVLSVKIIEADGDETLVPATSYVLVEDAHHPAIVARGLGLPTIPVAGSIEIEFTAGLGATWADLPPELCQAVLVLAADYYEHRHGDGVAMSTRVLQLIASFRPVRLFGRRT